MTNPHIGAGLPPAAWPASREPATPADSGDDPQQQLAWRREMERAQLSGWFKPTPQDEGRGTSQGASQPGPRAAKATRQASGTGPATPGMPAPSIRMALWSPVTSPAPPSGFQGALSPHPPGTPTVSTVNAKAFATDPAPPIEERHSAHVGARSPLWNASPAQDAPAASENAPQTGDTDPATATPQDSQAPIRLHEESTPSGQALWLAMRADDRALTALLPQLVLDLQRAQKQQGRHLHQVVCNGRLVWRDGEFIQGDRPSHDMFDSTGSKEI